MCVASKRLKERKNNVIEQLEIVEKYVYDLDTRENNYIEDFTEKCRQIECEVTSIKEMLDKKKVTIMRELEIEKDEEMKYISCSMNLAKLAMEKAKQVYQAILFY